ncbi:MAG: capsule assembly Wzi family protein [Bacteroidetes bacterium]|nr:capsule assembly Wzi family protein [Bacteroidota bacterium]
MNIGNIHHSNTPCFFQDSFSRYRLFSYADNLFKINLDPIFGIKYGSIENQSYKHWWNGFTTYGYLGPLGFSFDFRDNHKTILSEELQNNFSPEIGYTRSKSDGESFDYSKFNASIGYNWEWGSISVNKGYLEWGYGTRGKLVLSNKAPSYPYIRFDISPVKWFSFNYIHAWLASDVVDSLASYSTYRLGSEYNRVQYRSKYLASHTITIKPFSNLTFSLGESVIYSDNLEFLYLFPLSFFRAADHYLSSGNNNAGANSQFFFNISSRNHIPNTHLFASLIIDEIVPGEIFSKENQRNQIGYQLGFSIVDLPVQNLTTKVEYAKILPFVYEHYIPTQTYASRGYALGHWIGHNADQLYLELNYRILRGLEFTLWSEFIRKGENGEVEQQYTTPSQPFLFGLDKNYTNYGLNIKYQFIHDLFAELNYQYSHISIEQSNGAFEKKNIGDLSFAIYYGL